MPEIEVLSMLPGDNSETIQAAAFAPLANPKTSGAGASAGYHISEGNAAGTNPKTSGAGASVTIQAAAFAPLYPVCSESAAHPFPNASENRKNNIPVSAQYYATLF